MSSYKRIVLIETASLNIHWLCSRSLVVLAGLWAPACKVAVSAWGQLLFARGLRALAGAEPDGLLVQDVLEGEQESCRQDALRDLGADA